MSQSQQGKKVFPMYSAGLIQGIGRAAVPNWVWNTPGRLDASAWEQVRLPPCWTWRAAQQIRNLTLEVNLAQPGESNKKWLVIWPSVPVRSVPCGKDRAAATLKAYTFGDYSSRRMQ
jgi:hypothetical protein